MSPTSSEPGVSGAVGNQLGEGTRQHGAATSHLLRQQRARRRFERTFWALVAVLLGSAVVFLWLGSLQGPKLSSALIDPQRVVTETAQQLRLFANQPLGPVTDDQVTVTPQTPVTVTVRDELLVVQFEQPLRAATDYVVEVNDVSARNRDATSTFTYRFTTAGLNVLYLDRDERGDEILRTPIDGTQRGELVHAAEGIQHFAPLEGVLAVSHDAPDGASVLEVISADGGVQQVQLPEGVRVERLIAPPMGGVLAMVVTTPGAVPGEPQSGLSRALAVVDLVADGPVTVVEGLDGQPIETLFAEFLPDGTALIVQAVGGTVLRVELEPELLALPIGQIPTAFGLSADGVRMTGADAFGGVVLDLTTGQESRLDPSLVDGVFAFGGPALLTRTDLRVQKVAVPLGTTGEFVTLLVADDGMGVARVLFRTVNDAGSLGDLTLSSNDQFVAVEVTPNVAAAQSDGRSVNARPTNLTTVIVDIDTGAVVRTLDGFSPHFVPGGP